MQAAISPPGQQRAKFDNAALSGQMTPGKSDV